MLLDSQSHRKLRVHAQPAAHHGDNQRFVAVVVNEFHALAMHYPILFSKDADHRSVLLRRHAGLRCG